MSMKMDLSRYDKIIGYGIGQYYEYMKNQILELHIDYLCEARWREYDGSYDGIPVIGPERLATMKDVFVIVFSGNERNYNSIVCELRKMELPYAHASKFIDICSVVTGSELRKYPGIYKDAWGNCIEFAQDIEESIAIRFEGQNNFVKIDPWVSVGTLTINCGNNASCHVEAGTEIEGAAIFVSRGTVHIGKDCLFSYDVTIRNHDTHHIFDKNTGERVNNAGNISIGNHVWIGQGATLLGNASVGDNCVVGTKAVTSSAFPKECVIAGNPARIIRENVCWSKDNTNFYNRANFSECLAREAEIYFE